MEDFAGIDEMGTRRPVSRRLHLSQDDLTDEQGLMVGRQRNVPKTVANATLPPVSALEMDDLSRDLPKLPGDSGKRGASDLSWAAQAAALEQIDSAATQPMAKYPDRSSTAAHAALETLPVGPPPADSGITRMRLTASAVQPAVDYHDEMRGKTVEEAQRAARSSSEAKPARRGRRGRRSQRSAGKSGGSARAQGSNTMAKASGRSGGSGISKSAKSAGSPKASGRSARAGSKRSQAEPERASRRSRATKGGKDGNNQMMYLGIGGGVVLILLVVAVIAFSSGSGKGNGSHRTGDTHSTSDESPTALKQKAESLATGSQSDRLQARDLFLRAVELFDKSGDHASADDCQRKADGLHKDASLDLYNDPSIHKK